MLKIRLSCNRLIFNMRIPILGKDGLYIDQLTDEMSHDPMSLVVLRVRSLVANVLVLPFIQCFNCFCHGYGPLSPFRHDCINNFWPLSWFFNIGIIVSVCSMNKFDLYMIWFCGRNMKYMSSFQPKRSVKRILATFPGSLQCRMSTNRPWPSSPSRPFGRRARCSRSHWQQRLLRVLPMRRALCQAPPPVTRFLKQQQQHVLTKSMCSVNLWTLSEIQTLTKKLSKMLRGSGNGWPRSHGVRGGISLTLNLLTWTVMWCFFLLELKKPNNTDYEPDTLTSFHRSINRQLEEIGYGYSLVDSKEFKLSKKVLESRRRDLKQKGLGNRPNVAHPLSKNDEEKLWETKQFGSETPQSLINTAWYFNAKLFGFRGVHESRQLMWGGFNSESWWKWGRIHRVQWKGDKNTDGELHSPSCICSQNVRKSQEAIEVSCVRIQTVP